MTENKERIAKRIAGAGLCSRRDAERWIAAGRVQVNGKLLTTPACVVSAADVVLVDGRPLALQAERRVWRYHKPAGLITSHRDPQGRPTVFQSLPKTLPRVLSIGRLDFNSEGLLLLTTDGALARELEHPGKGWKRCYRVRVHGRITPQMIAQLNTGIVSDGVSYAPVELEVEKEQGSNTWVRMTLTEGKNREIRRLMEFFGLEVTRLLRVSYGPFQLGTLDPGEVREVPAKMLKEWL